MTITQKRYELTTETKISFGKKLFRIRALIDFAEVKKDTLGGWIEKEENLPQNEGGWVSGGEVSGDALVSGGWVSGGRVSGGRVLGGRVSGGWVSGGWVSGGRICGYEKQDLIAEILKLPNELEGIRDALACGKINGSTYSTSGCSCLAGTIAKQRGISQIDSGSVIEENGCNFVVDSDSPREQFFMNIHVGDTPENSPICKQAHDWVCEAIVMRDHIRATAPKAEL